MDKWEHIAERKIREAMAEGAFDNLSGKGRPLNLEEDPYEDPSLRMAHRLLRNNGFAPAWIEEAKDLEHAIEMARRDLACAMKGRGGEERQRILDGATGQFYDDFAKRSQPFVDVVKKAKSTTVGTITEAGLESQTADSAQVLVAVTVITSNVGAPQPDPHAWRIRISVQKVGDQAKVSNVEFVA